MRDEWGEEYSRLVEYVRQRAISLEWENLMVLGDVGEILSLIRKKWEKFWYNQDCW